MLLGQHAAQESARAVWNDVLFNSGAEGQGIDEVIGPLSIEGAISMDDVNAIVGGGFVVKADFGSSMESFFETDDRVAAAMQQAVNSQGQGPPIERATANALTEP